MLLQLTVEKNISVDECEDDILYNTKWEQRPEKEKNVARWKALAQEITRESHED